jgi:ferritin-like metal-binding protein YciE
MTDARQRIIRALSDAHASEQALAQELQSQIAAAPRGRYRKGLQTHLRVTRDHARRVEVRLGELRPRDNVVQAGIRLLESAVGQSLTLGRAPLDLLGKTPLELLRGSGGPEKVLSDAKDACATEALEIATYTGIEELASSIGDRQTARLAASIRAEEQQMLDLLLEEIPSLVNWVVDAQARGKARPAIATNGGAEAARSSGRRARKVARRAPKPAKRKAAPAPRKARATPRAGGRITGVKAPAGALPIEGYERLTAEEVIERLTALSPIELARIGAYEREHENRSSVLTRIAALRGGGPSAGSREIEAQEIGVEREERDGERSARVGLYGGLREGRDSILETTRE